MNIKNLIYKIKKMLRILFNYIYGYLHANNGWN